MKFHHLVEKAAGIGADRVAGHYARVKFDNDRGRWLLLQKDRAKDRSTFVWYDTTAAFEDALSSAS